MRFEEEQKVNLIKKSKLNNELTEFSVTKDKDKRSKMVYVHKLASSFKENLQVPSPLNLACWVVIDQRHYF